MAIRHLDDMERKEHWEQAYGSNSPDDVRWFQQAPTLSLRLIMRGGVEKQSGIIDVGGGASVLVDYLLDAGFENVALLDVSVAALNHARQRLGSRADEVAWFEADITAFRVPHPFAVWHDRAVFHFLTEQADRQKYLESLRQSLTPDGHAIIATFAIDGPEKCSGLSVCRYDAPAMANELGAEFQILEQVNETHVTPWNTEQRFSYFHFARRERL